MNHTPSEVETFIYANWPTALTTQDGTHIDCTKLDAEDQDCMTQTDDANQWCESCKAYNALTQRFYDEGGK